MAKLQAIKCPDCGSPLSFTDDQEFCYCSHCGSQIYKEDVHYDKKMEYKLKKLEMEDKQDKRDSVLLAIAAITPFLILLALIIGRILA